MPCPCDSGLPCDQVSCEGASNQIVEEDQLFVEENPDRINEPFIDYPMHWCECGLINGACNCPKLPQQTLGE